MKCISEYGNDLCGKIIYNTNRDLDFTFGIIISSSNTDADEVAIGKVYPCHNILTDTASIENTTIIKHNYLNSIYVLPDLCIDKTNINVVYSDYICERDIESVAIEGTIIYSVNDTDIENKVRIDNFLIKKGVVNMIAEFVNYFEAWFLSYYGQKCEHDIRNKNITVIFTSLDFTNNMTVIIDDSISTDKATIIIRDKDMEYNGQILSMEECLDKVYASEMDMAKFDFNIETDTLESNIILGTDSDFYSKYEKIENDNMDSEEAKQTHPYVLFDYLLKYNGSTM